MYSFIVALLLIQTQSWDPGSRTGLTEQVAEKVYLHTDRVIYNAGDDIWFKAYIIDPATNKPSFNTSNLHVELINPSLEPVQSRIVRIEEGNGNGDFSIDTTLPTGHYLIRAYTNHLRNFGHDFFYVKDIMIINPSDSEEKANDESQIVEDSIQISYFPEGGSLVDNVTSRLAFKAVDASGKGCRISGEVYSGTGNMICTFKSTHLGMGSFQFRPEPGETYYSVVRNERGLVTRAALPESFQTGITLTAFITGDKKLLLTLYTNEETLPSYLNQDLVLTYSSRNIISRAYLVRMDSLIMNFEISDDELPEGIIRVTISEKGRNPLCERLVYFEKNESAELRITTDKKEYSPFEKVQAAISVSGSKSISARGYFSFSAADADYMDAAEQYAGTISSWFLLESDVRGPIEMPSYYFDRSNNDRIESLDLLLMTQGWRDFQWKYDTVSFFSNETGFNISGEVKKLYGNGNIEGTNVNLALFSNEKTFFMNEKTDPNGVFSFAGIDITGRADVFISSTGKNENGTGRIKVDSLTYFPPGAEGLALNNPVRIIQNEEFSTLKEEAVMKNTIKKKYTLKDTIEIDEIYVSAKKPETYQEIKVRESRAVYGTPDKELVLPPEADNFAGDIFDMINGRIAGVRVIRSMDGIKVIVGAELHPGDGAIVLLDGMRLDFDNLDLITTIPVYMIDRVDVLGPSPAFGMSGANGAINIITKTGMRRETVELPVNAASFRISGFDAPRVFYSPKYIRPPGPQEMPDIRTTLMWEPNIETEDDGGTSLEYYNGQNPAKVIIRVEGITEQGIPLAGFAAYVVR